MLKLLASILLVLINYSVFASDDTDQAIHNELRALLQGLQKAVNEERYNDLAPYFHENLRVTTINQEIISSHEEIGHEQKTK
jgi:hypothetical protein